MKTSYSQEVAEHNTRLIKDRVYWMCERMADMEAERLPAISPIEQVEMASVITPRPRYLNKNVSLDKLEQLQGQVLHLERTLNVHIDKARSKSVKSKYT